MNPWTAWLFGQVTVRVTGGDPEAFLNRCAVSALRLRRVEREDPFSLTAVVSRRTYTALGPLGEVCQCRVEAVEERGLPFLLGRVRRRHALLAGLVLCLLLGSAGGNVILTLEVSGNRTIPSEVILSQLRLCGVSTGTWGPAVPVRAVENRMMLALEGLSYFALNIHGTRAEIIVREADPGPPVKDEETPAHIVSAADGILTHLEAWSGDAQFLEGDPVRKGDVLISGRVTLDHYRIPENGGEPGSRLVAADGRVLARTWRTLEAAVDQTAAGKEYTGREITRRALSVLGFRMKFYENSGIPYEKCDIMTRLKSWTPAEGKTLPVVWETETYREYTETPVELDPARAEALLKAELRQALEGCLEEGEILRTDYQTARQGDRLTVTLLAQCTEQIGRRQEMDTEEKVTGPLHPEKGTYGQDERKKEQSP